MNIELKNGSKWPLNTAYNGDWLDFAEQLPDKSVGLIMADPPYFEVKGKFDFIWDSFDDYLKDVERWAVECKRILADNGSLFWWGHAKKIAYSQIIFDKYFNLENNMIWRKTDCQTRIGFDGFRSFPPVTERVLFYSKEDHINLTKCIYHIRDYIRNEILKSKGSIVLKHVNEALGTATNGGGVASACLSLEKTEPTMMTKEMYLKLQYWCSPYLSKDYEDLRNEYEELRRPFVNINRIEDVFDNAQDVHLTGQYDHETQKPVKVIKKLLQTTTRKDTIVFSPFLGSFTDAVACHDLGLNWIGAEMDKKHYEDGLRRYDTECLQGLLDF